VLEPDLVAAGSPRWPRFDTAAHDAGVRAVFALPLRVGAIRVGVLDLYRDTAGPLTSADLAEALAFADAATAMVLHLQDHDGQDGADSALTGRIGTRAVVHQATGMITIQLGLSLAEALLRLRAHAYAAGRTVSAIAADVVGRRMEFDGSESGTTQQDRPRSRE
jgi:hypothetical protein